jgi:hypothetical protein
MEPTGVNPNLSDEKTKRMLGAWTNGSSPLPPNWIASPHPKNNETLAS